MDFVRIYYCSEFLLPLSVCLPYQGSRPCGRIIHRHIDRKCETLAEEKCVTSKPNREPESSSFAIFPPLPSDQQFPERTSQSIWRLCEITWSREKAILCQTGRQELDQLWHVKQLRFEGCLFPKQNLA